MYHGVKVIVTHVFQYDSTKNISVVDDSKKSRGTEASFGSRDYEIRGATRYCSPKGKSPNSKAEDYKAGFKEEKARTLQQEEREKT